MVRMPKGQYQVAMARPRHSLYSLSDSSEAGEEEDEDHEELPTLPTPLEKLTSDMCKDEKTIKELMVGRRVGFYKVRGEIGMGSFSRVKLAYNALTKDKVAMKVLDKSRLDLQAQRLLAREVSSMEGLQHRNVVRLYEVVDTPCRLYLVLEYAGGGDLHDRISTEGKLSDNESKITFAQILSAMKYLHAKHIIHRDLKAENVLYTVNACVKVADFGFSTRVASVGADLDTFCGSPPYAAPELFRDQSYLGPPVDVWAMGVLLFFMVSGSMPFRADTMGKLRNCVLEGAYTLPPWVPGPCQRLIRGILKPVPAERCAVDQMLGCDWLLPVEFPWAVVPSQAPSFLRLLHSEPGELGEEEEEVRASLEKLGVTAVHMRSHSADSCRNPIVGLYHILLHCAQKRRGSETVPVVRGMVRDHRREGFRTYRSLRHTSKLCLLS